MAAALGLCFPASPAFTDSTEDGKQCCWLGTAVIFWAMGEPRGKHCNTHHCSPVPKRAGHEHPSYGDATAGANRFLLVQFNHFFSGQNTLGEFSTVLLLAWCV